MTRDGQTYYYQTNARGDVVSLTDQTVVRWSIPTRTTHYKGSKHRYQKAVYGLGIVLTFPPAFAETFVSMTAKDSTYEGNNPVQTIVDWTVGVP